MMQPCREDPLDYVFAEEPDCSECEHPVRVATHMVVAARPATRRLMDMFAPENGEGRVCGEQRRRGIS